MTNRIRRSFKIRSMDSEYSEFHETPLETQNQGQIAQLNPLACLNLKSNETPVPGRRATRLFSPLTWLNRESYAMYGIEDMEFLQLDFRTVTAATGNFSMDNKLGQGGFGSVYKGKLPNGQEIAVKRLSKNSGQGAEEFKNGVMLLAKLQYRNLVSLQGFCLEGEEKILIYEFVTNKSLDCFLFEKQGLLDWTTRYKIIGGIARGILYLHEDSRLRIIHRDLKARNILLDGDMNPKISDSGMARIFGVDQTEENTTRIGTFGYMSPEYAMHGQFSVKSDVYSFGVLILEIISGKKNSSFYETGNAADLVSYVWIHWRDGTPLEVLDPTLTDMYSRNEVIRCIQIGLLCVQEDPASRPTMTTVVLMLNSYSVTLPLPQEPALFLHSITDDLVSISSEEIIDPMYGIEDMEFMQLDFRTVTTARGNFSIDNKLGQGGFGSVYKGTLPNGQDIAVKRLSWSSGQGELEFKNEVIIGAKLLHRNLVRIRGFCIEKEERLLIYEFLPNSSLNNIISDPFKRLDLDWETRYKIIEGIAKGLLYLHEDSGLRIIHLDLKASNILLDADMNPKITDFGLSRSLSMDETSDNTFKIAGTIGYMAPEYRMQGQFSVKSDVYSFGVLILEIISGKKSYSFDETGNFVNLVSYVWKHWRDGTPLEVLDPTLTDTYPRNEVIRCIQVGLLCVQKDPESRPKMATVVLMLNINPVTLPLPQDPECSLHVTDEGGIPSMDFFSADEGSTVLYPR